MKPIKLVANVPGKKEINCNSCFWSPCFPVLCVVEKFKIYPHVDEFHISPHDRCRVISNVFTWQMWRNLKSPSLCFVAIFFAIYALLSQNRFLAIYALLCGENFSQNSACGEKLQISGMCVIKNRCPVT